MLLRRLCRGAGCRLRDAEDGPLDGVGDAGPGQLVCAGHRRGQALGADARDAGRRGLVGEAAEDLAEDDPGVAARREEQGAREDVGLGGEVLVVGRLAPPGAVLVLHAGGVEAGVEGEVEVGPGVPVGDREDVEGVDLRAPGRERRSRHHRPAARRGGVEALEDVAPHVTARHRSPRLLATGPLGLDRTTRGRHVTRRPPRGTSDTPRSERRLRPVLVAGPRLGYSWQVAQRP